MIFDESILNFLDVTSPREYTDLFDNDVERSREITLQDPEQRSAWKRAMDRYGSLLQAQLWLGVGACQATFWRLSHVLTAGICISARLLTETTWQKMRMIDQLNPIFAVEVTDECSE